MTKLEGRSISYGDVAKVMSALVFVVGWTISLYTWVDSLKTQIELTRQEQALTHIQIDKRLTAVEISSGEFQRTINELNRSVDKVVVILDGIAKRMENKESITKRMETR